MGPACHLCSGTMKGINKRWSLQGLAVWAHCRVCTGEEGNEL